MKLRNLITEKYEEGLVNYDSLDTKIKNRIKDICDSYEQNIPSNIILEITDNEGNKSPNKVYRFRLKVFGVYNYYKMNEYQNGGVIAYFKKEIDAEKCIFILSKAISTNSLDVYDNQKIDNSASSNESNEVKFSIKKTEIDVLLY